MKNLKVIIVSVIALALCFAVSGCCGCKPSIDVSVCKPPCQGCPAIEVLTWEPITKFPESPNIQDNSGILQSYRPYLFRALVKNESNVWVRGVQVVFYWASWGLFDYNTGTPIGSVAADLAPNQSTWVRGPWSFVLNPATICVTVRIFHPCDKNLSNNFCFRNFCIQTMKYPFTALALPFTMDFSALEGQLDFKIDAPKGIDARILAREVQEEEAMALKEEKGTMNMAVKPGFVRKCTLVITNVGADYQPGDSFDVTVSAFQQDKLISSFTVKVEITK